MLDAALIAQFRSIVGQENVLTSKVNRVTYGYDATADMPKGSPDVIVIAQQHREVQQVVNLARRCALPCTLAAPERT